MFVCTTCDAQSLKWAGRCEVCSGWGTLVEEEKLPAQSPSAPGPKAKAAAPVSLSQKTDIGSSLRISTGDEEVNRVLGGGMVPGSVLLLSGEPGIGKSTLVASLAAAARSKTGVLYISGEENANHLEDRFRRLKQPFDHIRYLEAYPVEIIIATIEKEKPALVIVDSIQTMTSASLEGGAGTPQTVRYVTNLLTHTAKHLHIPILLIGQITKEGTIAGPKTLEHLVDVVLSLEGDPVHSFRLLRSSKNRFGSTNEVGVFEMTATGLEAVPNPSERFLEERQAVPGSIITAPMEGSRSFLVEVQALVEKTHFGTPVRRASGFDQNRLLMLSTILSKRAGMKLGEKDIYVNVIGGMELKEPASDLAVCAAIVSAEQNRTDKEPSVYLGEVGLGGEVRRVPLLEQRLKEIERLGIKHVFLPKKHGIKKTSLVIHEIERVQELLRPPS